MEIPSPTSAANEQPRNISAQQDDFEKEAYFGNSVHYDSDLPDFRRSTIMWWLLIVLWCIGICLLVYREIFL